MDWDVLSIKSFDDLLNAEAVMAVEKKEHRMNEVLGVAVMMSRKGSQWMETFRHHMRARFDNDCYTCHSTMLGKELALSQSQYVHVLDYTAFYHPGWTLPAVQLMFDPVDVLPSFAENPLTAGYALHMFESHENFHYRAQPLLLADNLLDVDSNFAALFRPFLTDQDRLQFAPGDGIVLGISCGDIYEVSVWNLKSSVRQPSRMQVTVTDRRGKMVTMRYNGQDERAAEKPLLGGYRFTPEQIVTQHSLTLPLSVTVTLGQKTLQAQDIIRDCIYPFRRTREFLS
jgi:hypothetical protein